ncbi:MAG: PEP-CTERM sorting domain-containing protein [Gemmatimonadales bacterium]
MKMIRSAAAAITLAGLLTLAHPASAATPVQLGWNSSLSASCIDPACTSVQFTLSLNGLEPTDNLGNAVPASILALGSPGYVSQLFIDTDGANGVFSTASVTSGGSWSTTVVPGGLTVINSATGFPLSAAPIVVVATFTAGGFKNFTYSGLAFLDANTAPTTVGNFTYRQGDFQGTSSAVPEPISMTLLASGLVGVGAARRRKNKASNPA